MAGLMNSKPEKMQSVILFNVLLVWSAHGAQPINMTREALMATTRVPILDELHMDKMVNQSNPPEVPVITERSMEKPSAIQIISSQKLRGMNLTTSRPIFTTTEAEENLGVTTETTPQEAATTTDQAKIVSFLKSKLDLLETIIKDIKTDNNTSTEGLNLDKNINCSSTVDESEARPSDIGPRLSAKLLKVLTRLGDVSS